MVKGIAVALMPPEEQRNVGKNWFERFLSRNSELATKFNQRLDRQKVSANDTAILEDFLGRYLSCTQAPI
jgi:hypothetical protein